MPRFASSIYVSISYGSRSYERLTSATVVFPRRISITNALLCLAVQHLISSSIAVFTCRSLQGYHLSRALLGQYISAVHYRLIGLTRKTANHPTVIHMSLQPIYILRSYPIQGKHVLKTPNPISITLSEPDLCAVNQETVNL